MTQAELDLAISKIIVAQEKSRSTGNSHFRKLADKRRLQKFIQPEKLKNAAANFYQRFDYLKAPGRYWWLDNFDYMQIWSVTHFFCARYNGLTGRIKKFSDCYSRQNEKRKRLIKKIKRRQPRKSNAEIPNGAAYKKISMKYPLMD